MILPGLKLQTRTLVLSIGVALVPITLLSVGVLTQIRASLLEQAQSDHRGIVRRLRDSIDANLKEYQRQMELLVSDMRVQAMKERPVHEALHNFLGFHDSYTSIFLYDHELTVRFVEFRNHSSEGDRLLGVKMGPGGSAGKNRLAAALAGVLATGKPAFHDYLRKDSSRSMLLLLQAVPSFTGVGPPVGVLSCAIQMYSNEFQDLLDGLSLEGSTYCLIVDRMGRAVARKGQGLPQVVSKVEIPKLGEQPSGENTGWMNVLDRVDLVTISPVQEMGSTIVVGRPRNEVLVLLEGVTQRIVLFAIIGIVLAVICALTLSHSLLKPILELTEGIRKVGEGAISHRVRTWGRDELAQAGEAFNRMAAQLQKGKLMEQIWAQQWEKKDGS
ncbi:MAG: HAMP domain-containing protein [Candidatus Riflebacteria bacterium]|nr:HAMP domain-containing protein [Candidatus Riflebacteria bacterium]